MLYIYVLYFSIRVFVRSINLSCARFFPSYFLPSRAPSLPSLPALPADDDGDGLGGAHTLRGQGQEDGIVVPEIAGAGLGREGREGGREGSLDRIRLKTYLRGHKHIHTHKREESKKIKSTNVPSPRLRQS